MLATKRIQYAGCVYTMSAFSSDRHDSAGARLTDNKGSTCASVTFWDAAGSFVFEMSCSELPLSVVEALIAYARAVVRIS